MQLKVNIINYKSIMNATVDLRPGLNILIGPNGSGKTCLLSALKFLRDLFRDGAAQAIARQGGSRRVYHHGQSEMTFSFIHSYKERIYRRRKIPCQFLWEIVISQAGAEKIPIIAREQINISCKYNKKVITLFATGIVRSSDSKKTKITHKLCQPNEFGKDLFGIWKNIYSSKKKSQLSDKFINKDLPKFFKRLKNDSDRSCFPIIAQFDKVISDIYLSFMFLNEYNILPDVARSSAEQLQFAQMAPNGAAVCEVIDALENKLFHKLEPSRFLERDDFYASPYYFHLDRYPNYMWRYRPFSYSRKRQLEKEPYNQALESINKELSAAVKPISHVTVDIDPTNGRRFVVFKSGSDSYYPEEVSDGTVKWLCILVSLFVPFSRVYLIEEPENFLHPWMQQRLISIMRDQAKINKTIFLLSSHSGTILNGANPDEILIVKQGKNGTIISGLSNMDEIKEVLAESDFHLGDLWVSGAIGGIPTDE